jgi:hypothetical protein
LKIVARKLAFPALVLVLVIVAPVPIVFLLVLVQLIVIAVGLVTFVPITPVGDDLIVIPGMVVAVIFIVDSHASSAT